MDISTCKINIESGISKSGILIMSVVKVELVQKSHISINGLIIRTSIIEDSTGKKARHRFVKAT